MTARGVQQGGTESDAAGAFQLGDFTLPSSEFYVKARKPGLACEVFGPVALTSEGFHDIVFVMGPESTVSGTVVDMSGRPLNDCGVNACLWPGEEFEDVFTEVDKTGLFTVGELHAGTYRMLLSGPPKRSPGSVNYEFADEEVMQLTLQEGEHRTNVRLVYAGGPGLTISGHIADERGRPVEGAFITMSDSRSQGGHTQSDREGFYTISALQEGAYELEVLRQGYETQSLPDVAAGSDRVNLVLERTASVHGRVVAADTGQPVTDFVVTSEQGERAVPATGMPVSDGPHPPERVVSAPGFAQRTVHDAQGRFELSSISSGGATVTVCANGFAPGCKVLSNTSTGQVVPDVTIALEREALIEGIVLNDRAEPVGGARIYVGEVPSADSLERSYVASTEANGSFVLNSMTAGSQLIGAYHPDYSPATVSVLCAAGEKANAEIVLSPGGVVSGKVSIDGEPAVSQHVAISYPRERGIQCTNTPTNERGQYSFERLTPGDLEVSFHFFQEEGRSGIPDRLVRIPAIVEDGEVTTVDIALPPALSSLEGDVTVGDVAPDKLSVRAVFDLAAGTEEHHVEVEATSHYVMDNLPAGTATVEFHAESEESDSRVVQTINIPEGEVVQHDVHF